MRDGRLEDSKRYMVGAGAGTAEVVGDRSEESNGLPPFGSHPAVSEERREETQRQGERRTSEPKVAS